ncbi:MAG: hypothetical protein FWH15_07745 [Betaproteobacteria bacterium]|nr:hypothetical protein [Betaproteobacteria bacterium]
MRNAFLRLKDAIMRARIFLTALHLASAEREHTRAQEAAINADLARQYWEARLELLRVEARKSGMTFRRKPTLRRRLT